MCTEITPCCRALIVPGCLCSSSASFCCPGTSPGEEREHPGQVPPVPKRELPWLKDAVDVSPPAQLVCDDQPWVRNVYLGWGSALVDRGEGGPSQSTLKAAPSLFPIPSYRPICSRFQLAVSTLKHTSYLLLLLLPQHVDFWDDTFGKRVQNVKQCYPQLYNASWVESTHYFTQQGWKDK